MNYKMIVHFNKPISGIENTELVYAEIPHTGTYPIVLVKFISNGYDKFSRLNLETKSFQDQTSSEELNALLPQLVEEISKSFDTASLENE